MKNFKAAYLNEIFKISKKKKITVAAILSVISVIIAAATVYVINNFTGIRVMGSAELSVLVLQVLSYTLIPLFATFVSIDMFGGEFADDTMKFTLTTPASRLKIFAGKLCAIASFIGALLLFIMILSIMASYVVSPIMPNVIRIFLAYVLAFFPLFVYALVVVLISNMLKGTTSAFMVSLLVFLAFIGIGIAFPTIKSFLFTSSFDWYKLILGSYINYSKLIRVFIILSGYAIMLFGVGFYLFENRDL